MLAEIAAAPAMAPQPAPATATGVVRPRRRGRGRRAQATGEIVDIVTPAGGESVTEGTILEWAVKVGDAVEDGDTVVEISTDKVDMELPAPAAGTITEILAEEGETVTVGQVIARMQLGAGAPRHGAAPSDGHGAAASGAPPRRRRAERRQGHPRRRARRRRRGRRPRPTSPAPARAGASPRTTSSTAPTAAPRPRPATRTVLKGGAAMLARYMDESREIPTATSFRTITVTTMDARRKQLKDAGQKVSFTAPDRLRDRAGRPAGHAGHGPSLRRRSTASRRASTTAP